MINKEIRDYRQSLIDKLDEPLVLGSDEMKKFFQQFPWWNEDGSLKEEYKKMTSKDKVKKLLFKILGDEKEVKYRLDKYRLGKCPFCGEYLTTCRYTSQPFKEIPEFTYGIGCLNENCYLFQGTKWSCETEKEVIDKWLTGNYILEES